jgi:phage shock protein C
MNHHYHRYYTAYRNKVRRHPLRRSKDGIIWGVCKGLADWLDISTGLVRGVFLILTALTGFFPLGFAYIIAAVLIPLEGDSYTDSRDTYW